MSTLYQNILKNKRAAWNQYFLTKTTVAYIYEDFTAKIMYYLDPIILLNELILRRPN